MNTEPGQGRSLGQDEEAPSWGELFAAVRRIDELERRVAELERQARADDEYAAEMREREV